MRLAIAFLATFVTLSITVTATAEKAKKKKAPVQQEVTDPTRAGDDRPALFRYKDGDDESSSDSEEVKQEEKETQKEPPLPQPKDIKADAQPIPNFVLTSEQLLALDHFVRQLITDLDAQGSHISARMMTLADFAQQLTARYHGVLTSQERAVLKTLPLQENGPVNQWLADNGFNTIVLSFLEQLNYSEAIDVAALEKHLKIEIGTLKRVAYRVPIWMFLANREGLASEFREMGVRYQRARAFGIDDQGRPRRLDPVIANVIEHIKDFKAFWARKALTPNPEFLSNVGDHFRDLKSKYDKIWSYLKDVEIVAYDLQGAREAVLYKVTMAENPKQILELGQLFNRIQAHREKVVQLVAPFFGAKESLETLTLNDAFKRLKKFEEAGDDLLAETRRLCDEVIHEIDRILEVDGNLQLALAGDTPWELAFQQDKAADKLVAASSRWENIRDHKWLLRHDYHTEHWTTQELRSTTVNGKTTTQLVTVHHNRSYNRYLYEPFETPTNEVELEKSIRESGLQIAEADSQNDLTELEERIQKLEVAQAGILSSEPAEEYDITQFFHARNKNLLDQIRNLKLQLAVRTVQIGEKVPTFDRKPEIPSYSKGVKDFLRRLDEVHWRRVKTVIGTTVGTAVAGGCGYAIWQMMQSGGGL